MREVALVDGIANLNILVIAISTFLDLPNAAMSVVSISFVRVRPNDSVFVIDGLDCCGTTEQCIYFLLHGRILIIQIP